MWARRLFHHPDKILASTILDYLDNGAPVGFEGPVFSHVSPNWKSTVTFKDAVKQTIVKDVELGRKSGPFKYPPLPGFIGSPMGAYLKKHSKKIRLIHDLSWPPGSSVNDYIPKTPFSVDYISVDNAVREVKRYGVNTLMCKVDLADAYKQVIVRPEDWRLLGSTWQDEKGNIEYYVDHVLPFGMRSSAKIFDNIASGLEFCMLLGGATNVCHYLDDFYSAGGATSEECKINLETMLRVCQETGVKVNMDKVVGPTTVLEFLGVIIDSEKMELRMSEDRMLAVKTELLYWSNKQWGTKRELLSLLGKLVFLSRVIKPGRIFLARLFELSTKVKFLHHKVRLSLEAKKDIIWWLEFAQTWNRHSVFYDDFWTMGPNLTLATDSSDFAHGATCGQHWYFSEFAESQKAMPIAWKELFAVATACFTWGHLFAGKRIMLYCDNETVVQIVNIGKAKNPEMMKLVRLLFFKCAHLNFDLKLKHIPGLSNTDADNLSRLRINKFLADNAAADPFPTVPVFPSSFDILSMSSLC